MNCRLVLLGTDSCDELFTLVAGCLRSPSGTSCFGTWGDFGTLEKPFSAHRYKDIGKRLSQATLAHRATWQTHTEEEPNALTVDEVPGYMAKAQELFPQHYAQIALGLATGRRPCELRPLRWKGETPDILWKEGVLLVRRSQVIGEAEDRTKTKMRLRIPLPKGLMEILENHVKALPEELTSKSDLLFPSLTGGYQTASVLAKPIVAVAKAMEIQKHLSPYFMRRTFQDLCRAASVHDFVARSISGHATLEMQHRYSSVDGAEVRNGLAKVISLAGFREARDQAVAAEAPSNTKVVIENSAITTESGDPRKEDLTMRAS